MHRRALVISVVVLLLGGIAAACGDDKDGDGAARTATGVATEVAATEPTDQNPAEGVTVDVPHWEWEMAASADSAPAGTVTFNAINEGTIPHNLRVAKTDLAPDALPVDEGTTMVDEEQLNVLASSRDLTVGEAEEVTVALEPGSYVLFCNVAGHYAAGLYAGFTVD
jgi:uncharacterized cupredoxin-like copper-binding protein